MRWFPITRCELVWKQLCANSVYSTCVITVGNGRVSGFYTPHRLTKHLKHDLKILVTTEVDRYRPAEINVSLLHVLRKCTINDSKFILQKQLINDFLKQKCSINKLKMLLNKNSDLSCPTVADGLKTISAPLIPYIIQFCGWWRP